MPTARRGDTITQRKLGKARNVHTGNVVSIQSTELLSAAINLADGHCDSITQRKLGRAHNLSDIVAATEVNGNIALGFNTGNVVSIQSTELLSAAINLADGVSLRFNQATKTWQGA